MEYLTDFGVNAIYWISSLSFIRKKPASKKVVPSNKLTVKLKTLTLKAH